MLKKESRCLFVEEKKLFPLSLLPASPSNSCLYFTRHTQSQHSQHPYRHSLRAHPFHPLLLIFLIQRPSQTPLPHLLQWPLPLHQVDWYSRQPTRAPTRSVLPPRTPALVQPRLSSTLSVSSSTLSEPAQAQWQVLATLAVDPPRVPSKQQPSLASVDTAR
jgi:hypothetical protein